MPPKTELRTAFAAVAERLRDDPRDIFAASIYRLLPRAQERALRRTLPERLAELPLSELAVELLSFVEFSTVSTLEGVPRVFEEIRRRADVLHAAFPPILPKGTAPAPAPEWAPAALEDIRVFLSEFNNPPLPPVSAVQVFHEVTGRIMQEVTYAIAPLVAAQGGQN